MLVINNSILTIQLFPLIILVFFSLLLSIEKYSITKGILMLLLELSTFLLFNRAGIGFGLLYWLYSFHRIMSSMIVAKKITACAFATSYLFFLECFYYLINHMHHTPLYFCMMLLFTNGLILFLFPFFDTQYALALEREHKKSPWF